MVGEAPRGESNAVSSAVSLIEGYLQLRYPTAVNASVIEPLKLMVVFVLKSLPPMKAR
jgi:hypothetical protein